MHYRSRWKADIRGSEVKLLRLRRELSNHPLLIHNFPGFLTEPLSPLIRRRNPASNICITDNNILHSGTDALLTLADIIMVRMLGSDSSMAGDIAVRHHPEILSLMAIDAGMNNDGHVVTFVIKERLPLVLIIGLLGYDIVEFEIASFYPFMAVMVLVPVVWDHLVSDLLTP